MKCIISLNVYVGKKSANLKKLVYVPIVFIFTGTTQYVVLMLQMNIILNML